MTGVDDWIRHGWPTRLGLTGGSDVASGTLASSPAEHAASSPPPAGETPARSAGGTPAFPVAWDSLRSMQYRFARLAEDCGNQLRRGVNGNAARLQVAVLFRHDLLGGSLLAWPRTVAVLGDLNFVP